MKVTIYTLEDPISNEIKYVGVTADTLDSRLKNHIKNTKYKQTNKLSGKDRWILYLLNKNMKPIIKEIETIDDDFNYIEEIIEIYWIWQMKSWGFNLLNIQGLIQDFKKMPVNVRYKTPINQYDLDGNFINRFLSVAEAAKTVNGSGATIQRSAKLKNGYKAYGYMWRYDRDKNSVISPARSKILPNDNKKIAQLIGGKVIKIWNSEQEAALTLNLLKSKISNCCNNKRKTHGGFSWKFV